MFFTNRLELGGKEVVYYPSRAKAKVSRTVVIRCETAEERRDYNDLLRQFCNFTTKVYQDGKIAEITEDVFPENNVCFEVDGMGIMFSDGDIRIGGVPAVGD